jgi:hypothetical protein
VQTNRHKKVKNKLNDHSALSLRTNNRFEVLTNLNETLKSIESVKRKSPKLSKLLDSNGEKETLSTRKKN